MAVKILGWFLLKWAGFGELLGWKLSTRSGNTATEPSRVPIPPVERSTCVGISKSPEAGTESE